MSELFCSFSQYFLDTLALAEQGDVDSLYFLGVMLSVSEVLSCSVVNYVCDERSDTVEPVKTCQKFRETSD